MKKIKSARPELLSFADADARLDGALTDNFQGGYGTVLLFPGDLAVKGDLLAALGKLEKREYDLIAVAGNLGVEKRIALYESTPGLYVGGSTTAQTLEGGDCEVYIQGGKLSCFVHGYYNDGILETSTVDTPWVINSNHDLRVSAGKQTRWIDNYGDDDDYDFGSENIGESFVPEVLDKERTGVDIAKLYKRLVANKPVLVAGAQTGTEKSLAAVKSARGAHQTELVLANKKLKAFPRDALAMPWLERLVLDGNDIKELPEEIGKLVNLTELSLTDCGLAKLPEELGALTKRKILRIGSNRTWDWSGDTSKLVPIRLPKSFGKLVNLEELDVSNLSQAVDAPDDEPLPDITPYELPPSAAKLKKLRVLVANQTHLILPRAMWGLASLEELVMQGASWCYLKAFPPYATTFARLKRLDLSGNFFRAIPSLADLRELEELDLGDALGLVKKLPNLSGLAKLRVLNVNGHTGRTTVPNPPHSVLRPLFKMKLSALEDLRIDRWGKSDKIKRGELTADLIAGIGKFRALKKLDLEFDGLAKLPPDFYELTALEEIKLAYNRLGKREQARLRKTFPSAKIDFD